MRYLLFLSAFVFFPSADADILCYKGDILHKGKITDAETEETGACRLRLEMMDAACGDDQVDVVAARAGNNAKNGSIGCELSASDKSVECECSTEKCNVPTMDMKNAIAAIEGKTDEEKKILQCFITVLENKFGLTTTTVSPTTASTTTSPTVETTVIVKNVTEKPDSSAAFCVLPLLVASLLVAF